MKSIFTMLTALLLLSCSATKQINKSPDYNESPAMLISWNKKIFEVAVIEDGLLTLKGLRTAAMVHIAMHDAFNSVIPRFNTYIFNQHFSSADPVIAMNEAAYIIVNKIYPKHSELWLSEKKRWIANRTFDQGQGILLGRAVAEAVINDRKDDRWDGETAYQWHPMAPGVYAEFNEHSGTPKGFVFGAGWANAKPFTLKSSTQFLSPPPPNINSNEYTQAFDEVKELGRFESTTRTNDQTHLALWWKDFAENSHNRLARQLAQQKELGLAESARMFALLNMAIFDAYVNVFYNKFHYNHWRPYSAIRWAQNDGNDETIEDLKWTNTHQHTYAFPSYPSAHGTACTAAMQVLTDTFGENIPFDMTTIEVDKAGPFSGKIQMTPSQRSFNNFSEAALECSMSRVYLGIHFRYDSIAGNELGAKIGNYLVSHYLQ